MALAGVPTPRFAIPNFAGADPPDLDISPGLPDITAALDSAIRYRGALTVAAFGGANYGLPTAPVNDDLVTLIADATNGVEWWLRYVAAEPTYKWRCIGGTWLRAEVNLTQLANWIAYAPLGTPCSITTPRAGDFDIAHGVSLGVGRASSAIRQSFAVGAAAALDVDSVEGTSTVASPSYDYTTHAIRRRKTAVASGASIALQVLTGDTTAGVYDVRNQWLELRPVRIA